MGNAMVSRRRAKLLSFVLFLVGLGVLTYAGVWWPGIMLVVGIPLGLRQYLLGRHYDMGISLFVFVGVFVTVQFDIAWEVVLPVLFTLGGIYIFFREWLESKETSEDEDEEDHNIEIEEDNQK
jgi:hypothetical protein